MAAQFKIITGGDLDRCGLTRADELYCWGRNTDGAVGLNTAGTQYNTPNLL